MIDTHAHLNDRRFAGDVEEVIARAREAGVSKLLVPGFTLESSRQAIELAERYPFIWAAVGMHPHDATSLDDRVMAQLEAMARHPKVVAIGEVGLDFYRDLSPRDVQREAFERQLALAEKLGKPAIVHERESEGEVMAVLRRHAGKLRGVLHCFSSGPNEADEAFGLGFVVSIGGTVTYQRSDVTRELATQAPLERILVETDCPWLTPNPRRRDRNEPAYVRYVVDTIARLRGVAPETVERATSANAEALFGLGDSERIQE